MPRKSPHALIRPLAGSSRRQRSFALEDSPAIQAIWHVVSRVPRGQVSTYGDIARAAGLPGRARLTGRALKLVPDELHLPWHRIVAAGGRIAFPKGSRQHREQARLLRSEGVAVEDGRVPRSALANPDAL
jgi:methylated-DNA-protein-cysteine methyltransferase related protein